MGKKQPKNSQQGLPSIPQPAAASPAPSALVRMMASASQVVTLVGEATPDWSEETVKGFVVKLPEADQSQFHTFIDSFSRLGARARDAHGDFKKKEALLEEERVSLLADREALNAERVSLEAAQSRFDADSLILEEERKQILKLRSDLVATKQELAVREAEVRGDLVLEREGSLRVLQEQIASLERQRDQLPGEIAARRKELMDDTRRESARLIATAAKCVAPAEGN